MNKTIEEALKQYENLLKPPATPEIIRIWLTQTLTKVYEQGKEDGYLGARLVEDTRNKLKMNKTPKKES